MIGRAATTTAIDEAGRGEEYAVYSLLRVKLTVKNVWGINALSNRQAGPRNYISTITGPWKAAAFFLIVVMILMLLNGAAILAGWHGASSRLMAYIALAAVGFFRIAGASRVSVHTTIEDAEMGRA